MPTDLCTPIPIPMPPGVPVEHECIVQYLDDTSKDDKAFADNCAECGEEGGTPEDITACKRDWRDWAIALRVIRIRAVAACLDGSNQTPPQGGWIAWGESEIAGLE